MTGITRELRSRANVNNASERPRATWRSRRCLISSSLALVSTTTSAAEMERSRFCSSNCQRSQSRHFGLDRPPRRGGGVRRYQKTFMGGSIGGSVRRRAERCAMAIRSTRVAIEQGSCGRGPIRFSGWRFKPDSPRTHCPISLAASMPSVWHPGPQNVK
jgi:hypothetical protein